MTFSAYSISRRLRRLLTILGMLFVLLVFANVRVNAFVPPPARTTLSLALTIEDDGVWESQPIQVAATIAGLSWGDVVPDLAWVRASVDGENWGSWESLALVAEHGPDPTSEEAAGENLASEPIYLGEIEWIQFRVDTDQPYDLRAELVETAGRQLGLLEKVGLFFDRIEWVADEAESSPAQPTIIPRETWGGPSCNPNSDAPAYTDGVRMMFVHHTTTYNTYPEEDVPGIIYAMCTYHVDTRGWKDIGYNFVIDRFGNIYEGRDGGIESAVWGAHTGGFNYYSFGVGLIGDFETLGPSAEAIAALETLAAWKLDFHHVNPNGSVVVESLGSSLYASGVEVQLNTISGHRDGSATSCPGDQCYPLLAGLSATIHDIGGAKIFGGVPTQIPPVVTEDAQIPFSFTEPMDWTFRLLSPDGPVTLEISGTGTSGVVQWDGMADGQPGGRGPYSIELDAVTVDDGEVPTPVREILEWYKPPFADDDFNRHETNIGLIAEAGFTEGCSSVLSWLYCPADPVRRDQMATFMARALDLPAAETDYFSDDSGNTHEASINALAAAGIANGCAVDRFCPLESIRRDHMAAFLARALGLDDVAEDYFDDDNGPYEGNINAIAELGITLGCGERTYCPASPVPRDQMASFLARGFLDSET